MVYVAQGTEMAVVHALAAVLNPGGRAIFGFHTDREFTVDQLDEAAIAAGWVKEHRFGTWQADPFTADSDWATSIYRAPALS